jgi:hypothetical protein
MKERSKNFTCLGCNCFLQTRIGSGTCTCHNERIEMTIHACTRGFFLRRQEGDYWCRSICKVIWYRKVSQNWANSTGKWTSKSGQLVNQQSCSCLGRSATQSHHNFAIGFVVCKRKKKMHEWTNADQPGQITGRSSSHTPKRIGCANEGKFYGSESRTSCTEHFNHITN